MNTVQTKALWLAGSLTLLATTACSAPAIHGFSIAAAPATISIPAGGTATLTVAATATGASPVTAALVIYNLPAGVTTIPASPTVSTGSQTNIVLSASSSAALISNQVQVTGYASLSSSNALINVAVVAGN